MAIRSRNAPIWRAEKFANSHGSTAVFSIEINGQAIDSEHFGDDDTIDVTVTANSDDEKVCKHCGQPISDTVDGWTHDENDARLCNGIDFDDIRRDLELEDDAWVSEDDIREKTNYTLAEPRDKSAADYVNWAGVTIGENRIEVQISVGEPRGCFTMTLEPHTDEDGNVSLILHTPYEGMTMPHVPLVHMHGGTMRLAPR
jgi:hypothetical protein